MIDYKVAAARLHAIDNTEMAIEMNFITSQEPGLATKNTKIPMPYYVPKMYSTYTCYSTM